MRQANQRKFRASTTTRTLLLAAAAASVIGITHSAEGSSATWSAAPAGSSWNAPNWVGGSGALGQAAPGDSLFFGASTVTSLTNDFAAGTTFAGLAFNSGASAFTLGGNDITLSGPLAVNSGSATAETINFNIVGTAASNISMSSATSTTGNSLTLNGNVSVGSIVSSGLNTTALPSNTLTIAANKTLTATGGLIVGSTGSLDNARSQLAVAGSGTLIVGNGAGSIQVSTQGNTVSTNITSVLDLSNLANFQFNGGSTGLIQLGINNRGFGNINLANTGNLVTAGSLNVGSSGTSNGGTCTVSFGAGTNTFDIDNINIAVGKGGGAINFLNATNGSLVIRGSAGTDASRSNITVGIKSLAGTPVSGSGLVFGTHTVDAKIGTLTIENASLSGGSLNATTATVQFGAGTLDVNNIAMALKTGFTGTPATTGTLNGAVSGTLNVTGGNLIVNNTFSMMNIGSLSTSSAGNLFAGFNLTGGTATIATDITQSAGNASNVVVTLDGGTLNMGGGGVAHNIGLSTGSLTFNANSGTLTNVAQINGGLNGLTKATAGTLVLAGTNSYTGDTNVNAGVLVAAGSLPSSANINVNTGGALVVTGTTSASANVTVTGVLGGNGNGSTTGVAGNVTLQSGGGIHPGASTADGTVGTLAMNTLTVNGGEFRLDLNSPSGPNDRINVLGAANFNGSSIITPVFGGAVQPGTYTLLTAASLSGTPPAPQVPSQNTRTSYSLHFGTVVPNAITLDVGGMLAANLTWTGSVDAGGGTFVWDVKNTPNWTSSAAVDPNIFYDLDIATFDDSALHRNVTINTTVSPQSVFVNNSIGHDYTFAGSGTIGGFTSLTKSGTGAATILTNNNYVGTTTLNGGTLFFGANQSTTGPTVLNAGKLIVDAKLYTPAATTLTGGTLFVGNADTAGALGPGTVILNGGNLVFNRTDGPTVGNVLAGSGTVTQIGTGSVTLTATSTFTGAVNINSGTVIVVGSAVSTGVPSTVGTPLGAVGVGTVNIPIGSTLELANNNLGTNNFGFGIKQFNVAGNGSGSGVILNNGTTQFNAFRNINLTGDATFGGSQRFDMRANPTTTLGGTLTLGGHTLHFNGNTFGLVGIAVTTGTISVDQGTLSFETASQALVDPTSAIVLQPNTHLQFFENTGTLTQTRQVIVNGGGIDMGETTSANAAATSLQILLKGDLTLHSYASSTGTLLLLGNITQDATPRKLTKSENNPLILGGSNSFTGGLDIQGGLVILNNANALNSAGTVNVGGGNTLRLNGNATTVSGISGQGFIENGAATPATFTVNNASDGNFDGVLQDGVGGGSLSVTKTGAGRLTLTSSNSYTGTTTINGGTLTIGGGGNSGTLAATTTITGTTSGTLSFNRSDNISFANPTTGAFNLSKEDNNVLTLPGTYAYTGTTAVNSGTLLVTGLLPSAGTVAVNDGGTLSGTGNGTTTGVVGRVVMNGNSHIAPGASSADGSVGTLTTSSLTVNSGELRFDLGTLSDRITVNGAAIFNGGSISVVGTPAAGTYTVLTAGALTLATTPTVVQPTDTSQRPAIYSLNTATANTLKLVIGGGPLSLTWTGGLNANVWDVNNTKNWSSGVADVFFNQDTVNFTNSSANRTVTLSNDVAPGGVIFSHSTGSYTINGSNAITGSGGVAITGGGTVVMNTNNNYTGPTAVANGTLIVGNNNAIPNNGNLVLGNSTTSGVVDMAGFNLNLSGLSTSGTGAGNVIGNSSTANAASINYSGGSSNFGGIIKDSINGGNQIVNVAVSSGTLTFSGNNTYSGQTQVAGSGALQIGAGGNSGSFGAGNINVDGTLIFNRSDTVTIGQNIGGGGTIVVNSGTVMVGAGAGIGSLTGGAIVDNGTIVFNRSDDISVGNTISGTGVVRKIGTNTATFSAASTWSGGLTVDGGNVRITNAAGAGTGTITVNSGATVAAVVATATLANSVTLSGGTLSGSTTLNFSGDLTGTTGTTSTILMADPQNLPTSVTDATEVVFNGNSHGGGTINVVSNGQDNLPDTGAGFRLRGTGLSDFSGVINIGNNVKGELQTSVVGAFSPAGTGKFLIAAGDATLAGTLTTNTTTGGYSEFNLRNNSTGNSTFGNDMEVTGTGLALLNPLGTAPVGAVIGMGNLKVGAGQELGIYLASGNTHTIAFNSVTLNGSAIFSPRTPNFGVATAVGSDMALGNISELVPGSSITMSGLRTLALTGSNSYTGGTNQNNGFLITNTNFSNGTLTITGGSAQVAAKSTSNSPSGVTIVPAVSVSTGSLDLTNNAMVVDYVAGNSPFASVQSSIITGYAAGSWNGVGINSSSAAAAFTSAHPTALGYGEASTLGVTTFAGHTVDNSSVLVRYTLAGDANLDGTVNALDFNAIATNFGKSTTSVWTQGDSNYDGLVNTADFLLLAQNFNAPLAAPPLAAPLGALVPEPTMLGLLSMLPLLARRKRRV